MLIYKDKNKLIKYLVVDFFCALGFGLILFVTKFYFDYVNGGFINFVFLSLLFILLVTICLLFLHYISEIRYYIHQPLVIMNITYDNIIVYRNERILSFSYDDIQVNYDPNQQDKNTFYMQIGKRKKVYFGGYYSVILARGKRVYEIKNVKNDHNVRKYIYERIQKEKNKYRDVEYNDNKKTVASK